MPIYKFTPEYMTKEEIRKLSVGREDILSDLFKKVEESASKGIPRHYLLVGPRGIGKTHLLLLLLDRIEESKLKKILKPIKFSEEEYSISRLSDIFLRVLDLLEKDTTKIRNKSEEEIVEGALYAIKEISKKEKKTLLLLLENLQLIFRQLDDKELGRLREILQKEDIFLIIGTAPQLIEGITNYEEPFYNFFEIIFLKELSLEDIENLIKNRAMLDNGTILENFESYRPRIKAVGTLTGGNPRLILLLYQIITESKLIEVEDTLLKILDELTPYFQSKMESLPPQQRKILDTLISLGSPAAPTEIANAARMDVNAVNSQIKRLEDNGFIEPIKLRKKKLTRYEIKERLFRIWREMRSPPGEKRIRFLVRFLEIWYTPKELLEEYKKIEKGIDKAFKIGRMEEAKGFIKHLCYIQEAFPPLIKDKTHGVTIYRLIEVGEFREAEKEIEKLRSQAEKKKNTQALYDVFVVEAFLYSRQNEFEKALKVLNEAIKLNPNLHAAFCQIGRTLGRLDRNEESLKNLDRAIELDSTCAESWSDRGITLIRLKRYEEALKSFEKALELEPDHANAWFNRGLALKNLKRYEEALKSYDKGLKIEPKDAVAWCHRGSVLDNLKKYEEALESFDRALTLDSKFECPYIWIERATILHSLSKLEESLQSLEKSIGLAKERKDQKLLENSTGLFIRISLKLSKDQALKENYGEAVKWLDKALQASRHLKEEKIEKLVLTYLKEIAKGKKYEFAEMALEIIVKTLGEKYGEFLMPFSKALEYIKTRDVEILEKLQKEVRQTVISIIKETKAEVSIPKVLE